ncbi:hypothetical protein Slin15195_G125690 [Septoria linicola]|uniref:Uncharacterized protein n=1 Tax=Septoria linicola TaxID=215465 RepID=A0A9Q9EQL4_9PEZI|nr:hypothetical protein Slin14017_G081870 [Septoria linicola]USW59250.1 hypothetical protein Slin15195_G125690 [Septoria linicola]
MAITRKTNTRSTAGTRTTTTAKKPSLLSRLRNKNQAKVTTTQSTNPITGTTTTTQKTTTHPNGIGYKGHGGRGPMAANHETHYTTGATAHHHKRKPSMGDKVSGALTKLKGSVTGKPAVKGAGTRRMHGTDGRGSKRTARTTVV